jgi:2-polyprenyl-3-methyl-5-hydroxy-6-metoxy-1,4-benzoquinol methylase
LIYQQKIPNAFLVKKIYEEWIDPIQAFETHRSTLTLKDYLYYAQEIISIIAYFDTKPSQLKFLDFGMGWGTWSKLVKAFGCECFGTELSESRIRHAQSEGIKVISWEDLPDHTFHFINTEQVFEHLSQPLETLIHLKSSLHSDGLLKISVPNGANIKKRLKLGDWNAPKNSRNSLNPIAPLEHINCFTHESLIKMADIAGFKRRKIPLTIQYAYSIYGNSMQSIFKRCLKPLYKKFFKDTYIFFSPYSQV